MKVWFVKSEILCTKQLDRDEKKVENKKINKPALPGANISEIFFLTWIMCTLSGGMIRGPVWHNTRSLPIGFTVAAQYEVPCGTIRGPMRHDTRSSAAKYEVLCGTIRGPVLRHDTRSWIQNLGPIFFSLGDL